eukprot:Ihof_evm5s96 gene=Ihof_evmTU5s96
MRDRLKEIQNDVSGTHLLEVVSTDGDEVIELDDTDLEVQEFLRRCEEIRANIEKIELTIKQVAEKHARALAAVSDQQAQRDKEELEDLMIDVTRLANSVRKELKKINQENKNLPEDVLHKAVARIRKQQQNTIARKFGEVMTEYNETQSKYKQKYRERVTRQYKIVAPTATDDEVEHAVDDAMENGTNIFQDQILSADHAAAKKALEEIEDRQKDIVRLEKSMRELHELFLDLALMVDQQGEVVDRIEFQV